MNGLGRICILPWELDFNTCKKSHQKRKNRGSTNWHYLVLKMNQLSNSSCLLAGPNLSNCNLPARVGILERLYLSLIMTKKKDINASAMQHFPLIMYHNHPKHKVEKKRRKYTLEKSLVPENLDLMVRFFSGNLLILCINPHRRYLSESVMLRGFFI